MCWLGAGPYANTPGEAAGPQVCARLTVHAHTHAHRNILAYTHMHTQMHACIHTHTHTSARTPASIPLSRCHTGDVTLAIALDRCTTLACLFVLEAPCPLTVCAVVPPRVREQEVLRRSQDLAERRREELNLRSPEAKAARRAEKARLQAERLRLALQW